MKNNAFVTKWVIDTVQENYPDDIALVVSHTTLRLDEETEAVSYFVPATARGRALERTFILDGEGFDIWCVEWARLEHFAALAEYNITCLQDGEILYARTPADAARFEALKAQQRANLADKVLMRKNALTAFSEAKSIFTEMLFAKGGNIRLGAGYVVDYLAQAVAFSNGRYFRHTQIFQTEELLDMPHVPAGFIDAYRAVIAEADYTRQTQLCHDLICSVESFLEARAEPEAASSADFQSLSDWYAELSYTWLRLRHYAEESDPVRVYMWAVTLQHELNSVRETYRLDLPDLLAAYKKDALLEFVGFADTIEMQIITAIEQNGGKIRRYKTQEEFLHAL